MDPLVQTIRAKMVAAGHRIGRAVKSSESRNLYDGPPYQLMIDSGTFWRCDHGYTHFAGACWRCGLRHPIRYFAAIWEGAHNG